MPIAGAMQCPAVLSNTFLAHRRGSESCAQPRCWWPRRRAKNALPYVVHHIKRILVQPGRRPPARRSANISPSSWTIRASPRRSTPAWSRPRTARATTSSGPAATAIEADQPRSPARERGFVMFMAAPPIRNTAIRMVGCQVLRLAHPDQILFARPPLALLPDDVCLGRCPRRGARDR